MATVRRETHKSTTVHVERDVGDGFVRASFETKGNKVYQMSVRSKLGGSESGTWLALMSSDVPAAIDVLETYLAELKRTTKQTVDISHIRWFTCLADMSLLCPICKTPARNPTHGNVSECPNCGRYFIRFGTSVFDSPVPFTDAQLDAMLDFPERRERKRETCSQAFTWTCDYCVKARCPEGVPHKANSHSHVSKMRLTYLPDNDECRKGYLYFKCPICKSRSNKMPVHGCRARCNDCGWHFIRFGWDLYYSAQTLTTATVKAILDGRYD